MQFKKVRIINKSKMIFGGLISLGVIGAVSILPSFAKYRLTDSINIANGVVNYKVPDLNMIAMYKSDDGENYTEIEGRMPDSGYIINEEKSYCNYNGEKDINAVLKTINGDHVIANLIKGDKCYLYFDKKTTETVNTALGSIEVQLATPDFSKTAPNDIEGIFVAEDGMYGGESYYWRGAVTNNYVKFANFCWRIIRINGDGSIRLIYDGTVCHANGTSTAESIAVSSQAYNGSYDRNEYVGYTYTTDSQRPSNNETGISSNLKVQTESWYTTNIADKGFDTKVATGKFCNDRNSASGYNWSSRPGGTFYYAVRGRLDKVKKPTLDCSKKTDESDIYNLKVGAITADEVSFAGGVFGQANRSYYLYNGQYYWTMSPSCWYSSYAFMFAVYINGDLDYYVRSAYGIRPVINLSSDITISSGDGSLNSPFIVN